jgi:hypothetical protein
VGNEEPEKVQVQVRHPMFSLIPASIALRTRFPHGFPFEVGNDLFPYLRSANSPPELTQVLVSEPSLCTPKTAREMHKTKHIETTIVR